MITLCANGYSTLVQALKETISTHINKVNVEAAYTTTTWPYAKSSQIHNRTVGDKISQKYTRQQKQVIFSLSFYSFILEKAGL
jgi:hypothetical protein